MAKKSKKSDIIEADIVDEMKSKYIDYSMSVIVSRALPDVCDGLKPVQRRILYAMYTLGILPGSAYKKSARTIGEVIAKYHPHSDTSVYDALVRMAQPFNMRYTLVDGQGNFGSIDGDNAAAMRYTEAKLTKLAVEMLSGLGKSSVDYAPNYDGAELEPIVLPTLVPNLLLNGADGIAVGMATKIPTHNLTEVVESLEFMIDEWKAENKKTKQTQEIAAEIKKLAVELKKYDSEKAEEEEQGIPQRAKEIIKVHGAFASDVGVDDLMKYIKGPDFPTGAIIFNKKEIKEMYATGRGRVLMRAVAEIEEMKADRFRIVITQVSYQVNKARLVAKIATLVRDKKIKGISDLRDESNRDGLRVVVELKKGVAPKRIMALLYKYTEMQVTFHGNFVALVNGEPRLLTLREILEEFLKHRQEVVIRKTLHELLEAKARAHILEGLKIALDNLDEVISTIRNSKDSETAKNKLMTKFKLSEVQAQAILDMQLRKLAALERKKIEEEYKEVLQTIKKLIGILSSPVEIYNVIANGLEELKEKYGDDRRTKVVAGKPDKATETELIPDEDVVIMLSKAGYIKRLPATTYKTQHRGGKGVMGASKREGDFLSHIFVCNARSQVLFFTNFGKVYQEQAYNIPEFSRQAKGQPIVNIINLSDGEKVTSVLTKENGDFIDEDMSQEDQIGQDEDDKKSTKKKAKSKKKGLKDTGERYLVMGTKQGIVKRVDSKEFDSIRSNGLIAIKLQTGDALKWVRVTDGTKDIFVATSEGRCIRFNEDEISVVGRNAQGVKGIRVPQDAEMIGLDVVRAEEDRLLVVSELGYGKISMLNKYSVKHRGGKGMLTFRVTEKTGSLMIIRVLDHPDKNLLILSKKGNVIKTEIGSVRVTGRVASGVKLIGLEKGDRVSSIACW